MIEIIFFCHLHKKLFRSKSNFYYVHRIEIIFFVFTSELWRIFCISNLISTYDCQESRVESSLGWRNGFFVVRVGFHIKWVQEVSNDELYDLV